MAEYCWGLRGSAGPTFEGSASCDAGDLSLRKRGTMRGAEPNAGDSCETKCPKASLLAVEVRPFGAVTHVTNQNYNFTFVTNLGPRAEEAFGLTN